MASSRARTLTVRLGNVFIGNFTLLAALRVLFSGRPEVVVINEGGKAWRLLAGGYRPGYRRHRTYGGDARGRTDVIVLVRRDLKRIGRQFRPVQASKAMPTMGAANHDRWFVPACFLHPTLGKVAVIGIHPSPGPEQLRLGKGPIAKQYALAMERLGALIDDLHAAGYLVIVAGDIQIRAAASPRQPFDPRVVLPQHDLRVVVDEHLDLIAADERLAVVDACVLAAADHTPHDGTGTGADHPFLSVTLARKKATK